MPDSKLWFGRRITLQPNALGVDMVALLLNTALGGIALYLGALALDWLTRVAVAALGPLLPDDVSGPDGWLRDTSRKCGVFDRRS